LKVEVAQVWRDLLTVEEAIQKEEEAIQREEEAGEEQ
jgi:hypothetical protein